MGRERLWHVICENWVYSCDIGATSAGAACDKAREERKEPKDSKLVAHLWDCNCDDLFEPCTKAELEARLEGTPLGRVCGL
jgi:hypothetical protein